MYTYPKIVNHENVNGVNLTLTIDNYSSSTNSKRFTISYKNKEIRSSLPIRSLVLAIIFNVIALSIIRISLTAILIIIIVLSFLIFFWITHSVQSESILVIPTIGVQTSVKYVFGREDLFLPWSNIDDVVINEVIKLNRVLYFLTILLKTPFPAPDSGCMKLVPLFKYTKPRLAMIEVIFSELQALLTNSDEAVQKGSGDAD